MPRGLASGHHQACVLLADLAGGASLRQTQYQGFGSMTFWAFLLVSLESLEPSVLSSTGHPILSRRNSPFGCAEASRKVTWFGGEGAPLISRGSADVCGALALPQALFQVPGTCKVQKQSSYPRGFHSSGRRQTRNKISASHVAC